MKPIEKKILDKAVELWPDVTPSKVAKAMGLNSHTNILYYFRNADILKTRTAEHAVNTANSRVIVQLLATGHKAVKDMKASERMRHLKTTV